jgi:hypothetical protein
MSYKYIYNDNDNNDGHFFSKLSCYNVIFNTYDKVVRYIRVGNNKNKEDPGFKTIISNNEVTIEGIDNIYYLFTMPIYLKSFALQSQLSVKEMESFKNICDIIEGGSSYPKKQLIITSSSSSDGTGSNGTTSSSSGYPVVRVEAGVDEAAITGVDDDDKRAITGVEVVSSSSSSNDGTNTGSDGTSISSDKGFEVVREAITGVDDNEEVTGIEVVSSPPSSNTGSDGSDKGFKVVREVSGLGRPVLAGDGKGFGGGGGALGAEAVLGRGALVR